MVNGATRADLPSAARAFFGSPTGEFDCSRPIHQTARERPDSGPIPVAAARGGRAPKIHTHSPEHEQVEDLRRRVPEFEGLFSQIDLLRSRTGTVDGPVQGAQLW